MPASRLARLHSSPPCWPLLAILLLLRPGVVQAADEPRASRSDLLAATPSENVAATPAPDEAWVASVRTRIKPGQLLRVTGSFGRFAGRASVIDEQGFSGLQQDPRFDSTSPLPGEPLSWADINMVERRGNHSARFAKYGGIGLGLAIGTLAAMVAGSDFLSPSTGGFGQSAKGFIAGSVFGGVVGMAAGALIGLPVSGWNRVSPGRRHRPAVVGSAP